MEKFKTVTGRVIPLPIKDVDTDMIIPAEFLTSTSKEGYGENVFKRLREQDKDFPFNRDEYKDAPILVAESNFGCGSSREHAVWALLGGGVKVVISKSFADIFHSNSAKNGLLLIALGSDVVDSLLEKAESSELVLSVNLLEQCVEDDKGQRYSFEYDGFRRHCMLEGMSDLDYLLSHKDKIDDFYNHQESKRYYKTTTTNR